MTNIIFEWRHEKKPTTIWVFEQVRQNPGCSPTEDSCKLEISDLERRGIVLSMEQKQRH